MLNGRNHPTARNGGPVATRNTEVVGESESGAFYGVYEQQLADELSNLLKAGPPSPRPSPAQGATAAVRQLPATPHELPPPPPQTAPKPGLPPSPLPRAAQGPTFVAARRPDNDFARAVDADDDPLPLAWRHEDRPPQPSWASRQMRAGAMGLGAGLVVILPAVAVLSGKLDPWLKPRTETAVVTRGTAVAAVQEPSPIVAPVRRVAVTSEPATAPPPPSPTPVVEARPAVVEQAAAPETPRIAVVSTPAAVEPERSAATPAPVPIARSIGTIEAFPAARAAVATPPVAPAPPARSSPDEAAGLLLLGQTLVKEGDIAGAREPLARAANLGSPEAMVALGETFDPNMLAAWGARNVKADASTARLFYTRAAAAGSARARTRLDALN